MNSKSLSLFALSILTLVFVAGMANAATLVSWNFDNSNLIVSAGTGTLIVNSSSTVSFVAGNPSTGKSVSIDNWDANEALDISVSALGYQDLTLTLDEERSATGPTSFKVQYSADGGATFTDLASSTTNTLTAFTANPMHTFNFSSVTSIDNNANVRLRILPMGAAGAAGTMHFDNILVSGTAYQTTPSEITACTAVGNPGNVLDIKKIDFTNKGLTFNGQTFGKDDEWFPLENIEVQMDIKNQGDTADNKINDITVNWGLWDTDTNQWVIEPVDEKSFDLKSGKTNTMTVSFKIDNKDLDADLTDLTDGNHYRFYVFADGKIDNATDTPACASDFKQASMVIESDFVILDNVQVPENAQCGATVDITAEAWNVGDSDQDDVSVQFTNKDLGIDEKVSLGTVDSLDNKKVAFSFTVPKNAAEKTYPITAEVLNEDGDVFQNDFNDDYAEFSLPLIVQGGCTTAAATAPVTVTANLVSGGKAGQDLVVKATLTNTGTSTSTYTLSSAGHGQWASSYEVIPSTLTLASGQSGDATFTFKVNNNASGEQTFYIESVAGTQVTRQPVSVMIEKSGIFSSITGGAISENAWVWGLGALNIILILVIIVVAFRVARK